MAALAERGLRAEIVSQRLNRRKIDLIPEPEWAEPPKRKSRSSSRRPKAGCVEPAWTACRKRSSSARSRRGPQGLTDAKVTSDAKHVEIGLTDKADAAHWVFEDLRGRGIAAGLVLIAGDEFGPLGGLPGSDSLLLVPKPRALPRSRSVPSRQGRQRRSSPSAAGLRASWLCSKINSSAGSAGMSPSWTLIPLDAHRRGVRPAARTCARVTPVDRGRPHRHTGARCSRILRPRREWWAQASTRDKARTPPWRPAPNGQGCRRASVDPLLRRRLDLHTGLLRQDLALPEGALSVLQLSSSRATRHRLAASAGAGIAPPGEWLALPARRALGGREQLAATSASIASSPTVRILLRSRTSPRSRGHRCRASARRAP